MQALPDRTGVWGVSEPCALVLAAGEGIRMGGQTKLARPWPLGGTVLGATLASLAEDKWPTHVVVGEWNPTLEEIVREAGATCVCNARYTEGVGSSIASGVRSIPEGVGAVLMVLGDMPCVPPKHYAALREAWCGGAGIAVTSGGAVPGPPVLFDARFRGELTALQGGMGARAVWMRHLPQVVEVRAQPEWLVDIDVPADL